VVRVLRIEFGNFHVTTDVDAEDFIYTMVSCYLLLQILEFKYFQKEKWFSTNHEELLAVPGYLN
jgi:hypothetical protein